MCNRQGNRSPSECRICYNWVFGASPRPAPQSLIVKKQNHAENRPTPGHRDNCRAARPQRAMGFLTRASGCVRLSPGNLYVSRPSPWPRTRRDVRHGKRRAMRTKLARRSHQLAAQQPDLRPDRAPPIEPLEALGSPRRSARPEPAAVAWQASRSPSAPRSLTPTRKPLFAPSAG